MANFTPEPGLVVSGRYRLETLLGQGGMGSVWRAQHLALNAPVAIKLIDPSLASSADAQARFIREAQAAAALRSPNVVQTLDFGVDQGVPYIVMELLIGESLADRLTRLGRLPAAETARIVGDIAKAIGKAHGAEIVHRDLKPDNVFLTRDEDDEVVKVVDFGVAKATGIVGASTSKTRTGAILGTPYYMSPEQAQGDKRVDWRTDLWALSVIAFESLVGRRPFDADGLGSLIMQICAAPVPVPSNFGPVPPGFDAWWAKATQRDPALRFQSARELAATLRTVLVGDVVVRPGSYADGALGVPIPAGGPAMASQFGPPAPTPYPHLSGSQPGQATVAMSTTSGARVVSATTGVPTTTGGVAEEELRIPKQGGVALLALALVLLVLLGGGSVAAVFALGVLRPSGETTAASDPATAPDPAVAAPLEVSPAGSGSSTATPSALPTSSAGPGASPSATPGVGAIAPGIGVRPPVLGRGASPLPAADAGAPVLGRPPVVVPPRKDRLGF